MIEFIAIAFGKSARSSTRLANSDCRIGLSNAETMPRKSGEHDQVPDLDVAERSQRRERHRLREHQNLRDHQRTTTVDAIGEDPAERPEREDAMLPQNATAPSNNAEPERRYVSHPIATCCSHVPISDRLWPTKNRRKFRYRSARNVWRRSRAIT
jgi:hypothetical protein